MKIKFIAITLLTIVLTACSPVAQNSGPTSESTPTAPASKSSTAPTSTPLITPTAIPEVAPEVVETPQPPPPANDQLENLTPQPLTLYIAGYGDQPEIDACIGWIILTRYEANGIQPTIAEHNSCGGAAILNLPIGTQLTLAGGGMDGLYEIVDSRDAPQIGTTLDIPGIAGEILAQSCYFDSAYMRFIGLNQVG